VHSEQDNPQPYTRRSLLTRGVTKRLRLSMNADPTQYSDEFAATAREEVDRLALRSAELRIRAEAWISRGETLLREAERLESRIQTLDELLGRAPQLRLDLQTTELQGQELRQAAMEILLRRQGSRKPIHYKEWYGLLASQGLSASGKNPLATFLTQITRSPIVERVQGATGIYQLDPNGALERARNDLGAAQRSFNAVRDSSSARDTNAGEVSAAETRLTQALRRFEAVVHARTALLRARLSA
jgi:hypothetical protein